MLCFQRQSGPDGYFNGQVQRESIKRIGPKDSVKLLRACGSLDDGDEFAVVENGSVNTAMTAFTEKTLGGEVVGNRFEISVEEVSNLLGFPFVVLVVGIACCYRGPCIAGMVAHTRREEESVERVCV